MDVNGDTFPVWLENPRVIYEHGFQADFANNQASWSGAIGKKITEIVGVMEYLEPDIDVILGSAWESVSRLFTIYNGGLTPVKNPDGFNTHEYLNFYISLMEKYNRGDTDDHHDPTDLALAVVGHTHSPRLVKNQKMKGTYYLMDCGSWVNGGHEIGVISGERYSSLSMGVKGGREEMIKPSRVNYKGRPQQ